MVCEVVRATAADKSEGWERATTGKGNREATGEQRSAGGGWQILRHPGRSRVPIIIVPASFFFSFFSASRSFCAAFQTSP